MNNVEPARETGSSVETVRKNEQRRPTPVPLRSARHRLRRDPAPVERLSFRHHGRSLGRDEAAAATCPTVHAHGPCNPAAKTG